MIEALALLALPLGGSGVHREDEILPRLVSRLPDRLQDMLDGILIGVQIRSESALISDRGGIPLRLQKLLESVEDLRAPAESLAEGRSSRRHNHKFLRIHGVCRVRAAIQNIHHRNREAVSVHAAQKAVERDAERLRRGICAGNGNRENRIGSELRLILRPIRREHRPIHRVDILGIHASYCRVDDGIDILDSLQNALPAVATLVSVPKLQRLKFPGGRAAGGGPPPHRAAAEIDLCLHCRISSGIDDLSSDYLLDLKMLHRVTPFLSVNLEMQQDKI